MFNDLVAALADFFNGLLTLAQGGFQDVNQVVGLVIALIAAILMPSWGGLFGSAAGAALVHILFDVLRPVLDGGAVVLPPLLSLGFWTQALALFLGYAVVIAVFFLLKSLLRLGSRGHARHAH